MSVDLWGIDPEAAELVGEITPEGEPIPPVSTAAEIAALVGVSASRGRELADRGVFARVGRNRFDTRESLRRYLAEIARQAKRPVGADLDREKLRVQKETADKLATANAIARGDLVPAADVTAAWATILTDVRAAMLAIPSRLPELDRAAVARIDSEIHAALEALSNG